MIEHGFNEKIAYGSSYLAPRARVLVVDGKCENREVFREILKDMQVQVDEAENGKDAFDRILDDAYDIIFVEYLMPGMDGIDVLLEMQYWENYPNRKTPVVIVTSSFEEGAREKFLEIGFADYLAKPIGKEQLLAVVDRLLPVYKKVLKSQPKMEEHMAMDTDGEVLKLIYTQEHCVGCNRCIGVCPCPGANIAQEAEDGTNHIVVDSSRCIACGACIDACEHDARAFEDDTLRFFRDLQKGKRISLFVAPAFRANYGEKVYHSILRKLKALGVKHIYNVAFGADITTWAYVKYITEQEFYGGITQPCPAVVGYIEKYLPNLLPMLMPVHSPLMCSAIYARKYLKITDEFAFLSPCIAKRNEINDPNCSGYVSYNVTFSHLMEYLENYPVDTVNENLYVEEELEVGLGAIYPMPGGLKENVQWLLGEEVLARQVEGEKRLYHYLKINQHLIEKKLTQYLFVDALNCSGGCLFGTGIEAHNVDNEAVFIEIEQIRQQKKKAAGRWNSNGTPKKRLAVLNERFSNLQLSDFIRHYTDKSARCRHQIPGKEEEQAIFLEMLKDTKEKQAINCGGCGYDNCKAMVEAIYNGYNHKENCVHYEKDLVLKEKLEKELAKQENAAKGRFLANMSHEIRTPINAILGLDTMILRESKEKEIRQYAADIEGAGQTLLALINDILDLSKIESGKMELILSEYDFSSLIYDVIHMISMKAKEKGLEVKLELDDTLPSWLYGDDVRLRQILVNLMNNAVKYTKEGRVTLKITSVRNGKKVCLHFAVEDTGIGIKQEDMEQLFVEFGRIEEKLNHKIEGTGLGMSITIQLLALMGSKLEVSSVYGEGSVFSFDLEQEICNEKEIGRLQQQVERQSLECSYKVSFVAPCAKLLVVDDTATNRKVFCNLLKETKCQIDQAASGKEALDKIAETKYDMIFLDHMMPEMDGLEVHRRMRSWSDYPNKDTPVIALTANAISGAREMYLEEGFEDYLSKPIHPEKLEEMVAKYLSEEKKKCMKNLLQND